MAQKWFEKLAQYLERKEEEKQNGKYVKVIMDREGKEPYLIRYYLLNLRPFARLNLHKVLQSDEDGLHDHPWPWATRILQGGYWEATPNGRYWREPGKWRFRSSKAFHRLELDPKCKEQTWTLFLMGPKVKDWGFLDEDENWVKWDEYLARREQEGKTKNDDSGRISTKTVRSRNTTPTEA